MHQDLDSISRNKSRGGWDNTDALNSLLICALKFKCSGKASRVANRPAANDKVINRLEEEYEPSNLFHKRHDTVIKSMIDNEC